MVQLYHLDQQVVGSGVFQGVVDDFLDNPVHRVAEVGFPVVRIDESVDDFLHLNGARCVDGIDQFLDGRFKSTPFQRSRHQHMADVPHGIGHLTQQVLGRLQFYLPFGRSVGH